MSRDASRAPTAGVGSPCRAAGSLAHGVRGTCRVPLESSRPRPAGLEHPRLESPVSVYLYWLYLGIADVVPEEGAVPLPNLESSRVERRERRAPRMCAMCCVPCESSWSSGVPTLECQRGRHAVGDADVDAIEGAAERRQARRANAAVGSPCPDRFGRTSVIYMCVRARHNYISASPTACPLHG